MPKAKFGTSNQFLHLKRFQVHNYEMRTNVNIADDAREFADLYAYANGLTLGDAISELIRKGGKSSGLSTEEVKFGRSAAGFPTFPRRGRVITTEMVEAALEEFP